MLRDWPFENQAYRAPGPNLLLASTNNRLTVLTVYEAYPSWQGREWIAAGQYTIRRHDDLSLGARLCLGTSAG